MQKAALTILGAFRLSVAGKVIERFRTNRVQALLAYLAVEAGRGRTNSPS